MTRKSSLAVMLGAGLFGLLCASSALAYDQYNPGCSSCHGAFTDSTSTKGSTFPGGDKHAMHRSSQNMSTDCKLCHKLGDGNNPFIGSSDGNLPLNPGIGCTGCHPAAGLRLHHVSSGTIVCLDCHSNDPPPAAENVKPVYYGTADTKAANPCNPTAAVGVNENWTTNGFEGTDTDGDLLYDMADPDCSGVAATPGEAGKTASMLVTGYNKASGALTISYGVACATTTNHIEHGLIANVKTYTYAGQVCALGNTGTATFTVPDGSFFLVVADSATNEGSYGKRRTSGALTERPEDTTSATCQKPQDLATRCDP